MENKKLNKGKKISKIKFAFQIIKELIVVAIMLFLVACVLAMIYAFFLIVRG